VTDGNVTIVIRVLSSRVTWAVGSKDASTAVSRSCSEVWAASNRQAP
jgi:hypothetical protein